MGIKFVYGKNVGATLQTLPYKTPIQTNVFKSVVPPDRVGEGRDRVFIRRWIIWHQSISRGKIHGMDKNLDFNSTLRFDGCIATNIEQAYRHLEQVYERLITPLGLSMLEWYALRALYAKDGLSASHLATLVCRHPSSMTALLDRMQDKGLLRREIDPADRRSVRIFLCGQGNAYRSQVESVAGQLDRLVSDHITPQQMETFLYVLGVLQNVRMDEPG